MKLRSYYREVKGKGEGGKGGGREANERGRGEEWERVWVDGEGVERGSIRVERRRGGRCDRRGEEGWGGGRVDGRGTSKGKVNGVRV